MLLCDAFMRVAVVYLSDAYMRVGVCLFAAVACLLLLYACLLHVRVLL